MNREMYFKVILSCLRFSVKKEPFSEEMRSFVTEDILSDLFTLSDRQDLAHLVGYALKKNALLPKDHTAAPLFEKKIVYALYRTERIEYQRRALCAVLEEEKIDHIPLKGALIRDFYPETWMRTSSDADVLIPKERLEEAAKLLCEKEHYTVKERGGHDISFTAPGGENMELHFDLVGEHLMPECSKILQRVWDMALSCEGKEYEKKMPVELFLFYHIAHMAKHIYNGGIGIRFFLDYYLIREKMAPEENLYKELLHRGGIDTFERTVSDLCKFWFEDGEETEKTKLLQDLVFSTGIFGEQKSFVAIRRGEKGIFSYFASRVFASYELLCQTYPSLEGKKYLLPFYQLRRVIDHFRYAGFKHTVNEAKENLTLSSDEGEKMVQLLKEMDLRFHE